MANSWCGSASLQFIDLGAANWQESGSSDCYSSCRGACRIDVDGDIRRQTGGVSEAEVVWI